MGGVEGQVWCSRRMQVGWVRGVPIRLLREVGDKAVIDTIQHQIARAGKV